ncbi:MAG: diguanylate cyclase [Cycloclasticus sp.]|nr:diguanylate cyclase [Cycloclasticus sp.]
MSRKRYIIAIFFLCLYTGWSLYYASNKASELYKQSELAILAIQEKSNAIYKLSQVVQNRSIILLKMLNERDAFIRDSLYQQLFHEASKFREYRDELKNSSLTEQQNNALKDLLELTAKNAEIQMLVATQLLNEQTTEAAKELFNSAIPNQIPIAIEIRGLSDLVEKENSLILTELRNKLAKSQIKTITLTSLFSVSAIFLLYILINWLREGERYLANKKAINDNIIDSASDAIVMVNDDGIITLFNRAASLLFGYETSEVINKPIKTLISSGFDELLMQLNGGSQGNKGQPYENFAYHKNLDKTPIQITITDTGITGNNRYSLFIRDISQSKENERRIVEKTIEIERAKEEYKRLSETDALTQIPNRRAYDSRLADEINTAKRSGQKLALLLFDIDSFKQYNDFYGHDLGDLTLKRIADTISATLPRSTDFVARFGGEEFVVLLPSTDTAGAYEVAERIRMKVNSLAIPHEVSTTESVVTVSVGLSSMHADEMTGVDLFKQADEALYVAKASGKNRTKVFKANPSKHLKSV